MFLLCRSLNPSMTSPELYDCDSLLPGKEQSLRVMRSTMMVPLYSCDQTNSAASSAAVPYVWFEVAAYKCEERLSKSVVRDVWLLHVSRTHVKKPLLKRDPRS